MLLSSPIFFLRWNTSVHASQLASSPSYSGHTFQIPTRFDPDVSHVLHSDESPLFSLAQRQLQLLRSSGGISPLAAHRCICLLICSSRSWERNTLPPTGCGRAQRGSIDHPAIKQTIPWYSASSSIPRSVTGSDAQQ